MATADKPRRALQKNLRGSKAPAISRAAAILRLLGKSDAPLRLQTIADELGLVPSTCLYVLRALVAEELVAFDEATKRYSLEVGVLTLARQWLRRNVFPELAQPLLDRLSAEFGVTAMGVQYVGLDHIVVVAASRAAGNFQLSAEVGSRFPALISATGRCLAAFGNYPDEELEARFGDLRWDAPPTFADWQQQVNRARRRGYAVDAGNYIDGVTVIAAPVWSGGERPGHALVALGISSALQRGGLAPLQEAVLVAAQGLSGRLAGTASPA